MRKKWNVTRLAGESFSCWKLQNLTPFVKGFSIKTELISDSLGMEG